ANVSSSWIGPLVCTTIIEHVGIRKTWWFLVTQFFIPPSMLMFVNVDKGRQEAIEFFKNEQAEKSAITGSDMTVVHDDGNEKGFEGD
ncbi:hypothetical protein BGX26_008750, partial [Mortierella sp. AD094]